MSTSDVELWQEEMNSPAPQNTHTLILYICTHTLWPEFVYPARSGPTRTPPPLSSFDVWKVEGNQSHFLHSGWCRLWFPGAGGATLAVKCSCASGVWEVYGATRSAKNNRGKCWSKASTRGRRKGRWSRHRTSPQRNCVPLVFSGPFRVPHSAHISKMNTSFLSLTITDSLTTTHSTQKMRKVCRKHHTDFWSFGPLLL